MKKEELKKELEKLKDFKVYVFEGDVYVKAEDYKEIAIENKKLKSDLAYERTMLDNVRAEYESLQNVNKKMEEENENLKAIIKHYKKFEEGKEKLKGMLMEEDTLQELRDLGEI